LGAAFSAQDRLCFGPARKFRRRCRVRYSLSYTAVASPVSSSVRPTGGRMTSRNVTTWVVSVNRADTGGATPVVVALKLAVFVSVERRNTARLELRHENLFEIGSQVPPQPLTRQPVLRLTSICSKRRPPTSPKCPRPDVVRHRLQPRTRSYMLAVFRALKGNAGRHATNPWRAPEH
jgi:hypothetical protein